jgi:hypothetical protein
MLAAMRRASSPLSNVRPRGPLNLRAGSATIQLMSSAPQINAAKKSGNQLNRKIAFTFEHQVADLLFRSLRRPGYFEIGYNHPDKWKWKTASWC